MNRLIAGLALLSLVTVAGVASSSFVDLEEMDAEVAELGYDEAVELLVSSIAEQRQAMVSAMLSALELGLFDEDGDLDGVDDEITEVVFEGILDVMWTSEQQMRQAMQRMLLEQDTARLETTLLNLPSIELATFLSSGSFLNTRDDLVSLSSLIEHSPRLRRRLTDELDNTASALELVVGPELHGQLLELELESEFGHFGSESVGEQFLLPVLRLLPPAEAGVLVEDVIEGRRFAHLREPVDQMVSGGMFGSLVELPDEWLRERIEAGESMWIMALAGKDDDFNLPLLFDHIESLSMEEQIRLIALEPHPGFLPYLRDAHTAVMISPMCADCDGVPEFEKIYDLTIALLAMDMLVTVDLFEEMLAVIPEPQRQQLASMAVHLAKDSDHGRALTLRLLGQFPDLSMGVWQLSPLLEDADSELLRGALEVRIEGWVDGLIGHNAEQAVDSMMDCEPLSMLLIAHGQGLLESWPDLVETALEMENAHKQVVDCDYLLVRAATAGGNSRSVVALLELWEIVGADAENYTNLVRRAMAGEGGDREAIRLTILSHLEDSEVWASLPATHRDLLQGRLDQLPSSSLSCEAPEDWLTDEEDDEFYEPAEDVTADS